VPNAVWGGRRDLAATLSSADGAVARDIEAALAAVRSEMASSGQRPALPADAGLSSRPDKGRGSRQKP